VLTAHPAFAAFPPPATIAAGSSRTSRNRLLFQPLIAHSACGLGTSGSLLTSSPHRLFHRRHFRAACDDFGRQGLAANWKESLRISAPRFVAFIRLSLPGFQRADTR
jgi:hypothetical protein